MNIIKYVSLYCGWNFDDKNMDLKNVYAEGNK